jgi:hypothetical protein
VNAVFQYPHTKIVVKLSTGWNGYNIGFIFLDHLIQICILGGYAKFGPQIIEAFLNQITQTNDLSARVIVVG